MEPDSYEKIQQLVKRLQSEYQQDNQAEVHVVKEKIVRLLPQENEEKKAYLHKIIVSQDEETGITVESGEALERFILGPLDQAIISPPGGYEPPPDLEDFQDFKASF